MTGRIDLLAPPARRARDLRRTAAAGSLGDPHDYDREYCVDLVQLAAFLRATQPTLADALDSTTTARRGASSSPACRARSAKRGVIDVLRHGIKHGPHHVDLFYGTPSPGNAKAAERYAQNRFSVTRQLRYSRDETQLALDLGLFINGLPVATFELKNSLTKQTVETPSSSTSATATRASCCSSSAAASSHFAVDDSEVRFCTHLKGKASWFLPFNQGWNDGAGNPPNPDGLKTDYLWKRILTREGLTDILENYAQVVEEKNEKTGKKKPVQIFPRYHQLDVVRRLLADAGEHGAGRRYLIQHSAGSGKSNSIAWLAHQLIGLRAGRRAGLRLDHRRHRPRASSTSRSATRSSSSPRSARRSAIAEDSGDLREFIEEGKKIIISTVQKFPFILDEIGGEHRGRQLRDHHRRGALEPGRHDLGRDARRRSSAAGAEEDDETIEDTINRLMEARKLLPNASYFAFTATPKNKTLEIFGEPFAEGGGKSSTGRSTATR